MDATLVPIITAWFWVVAGAALLGVLVLTFFIGMTDGFEEEVFWIGAAAGLAGSGMLVMALAMLGFATPALWAWRVSAPVLVVAATLPIMSPRTARLTGGARTLAAVNLLVTSLLTAASFAAQSVTVSRPSSVAPPAPLPTVITIDGVRLWHGVALGMLAFGTVVFLVLFIRMLERGVPPQIESHWGGIGGGLGGWRMSASLTYLGAALVFGVLFAIFVFQLELKGESRTTPTDRSLPSGSAPQPNPGASKAPESGR